MQPRVWPSPPSGPDENERSLRSFSAHAARRHVTDFPLDWHGHGNLVWGLGWSGLGLFGRFQHPLMYVVGLSHAARILL
jgi:hypothetical protein